jgi:hypothetical protein
MTGNNGTKKATAGVPHRPAPLSHSGANIHQIPRPRHDTHKTSRSHRNKHAVFLALVIISPFIFDRLIVNGHGCFTGQTPKKSMIFKHFKCKKNIPHPFSVHIFKFDHLFYPW